MALTDKQIITLGSMEAAGDNDEYEGGDFGDHHDAQANVDVKPLTRGGPVSDLEAAKNGDHDGANDDHENDESEENDDDDDDDDDDDEEYDRDDADFDDLEGIAIGPRPESTHSDAVVPTAGPESSSTLSGVANGPPSAACAQQPTPALAATKPSTYTAAVRSHTAAGSAGPRPGPAEGTRWGLNHGFAMRPARAFSRGQSCAHVGALPNQRQRHHHHQQQQPRQHNQQQPSRQEQLLAALSLVASFLDAPSTLALRAVAASVALRATPRYLVSLESYAPAAAAAPGPAVALAAQEGEKEGGEGGEGLSGEVIGGSDENVPPPKLPTKGARAALVSKRHAAIMASAAALRRGVTPQHAAKHALPRRSAATTPTATITRTTTTTTKSAASAAVEEGWAEAEAATAAVRAAAAARARAAAAVRSRAAAARTSVLMLCVRDLSGGASSRCGLVRVLGDCVD